MLYGKNTRCLLQMKLLFLLLIVPLVSSDKVIQTNNGPVRGISLPEKEVEAFLGIPYAEPPLGKLRFAKPVPKSSWDETYDANELPPSCIQATIFQEFGENMMINPNTSEDCLFLNLWVPEGGSDLKPIMFFIHGGAYMFGSSNSKIYDGATLSKRGDVIVVTTNYRIGTLGFFTAYIDDAPGNMGMYDQVMAIQWIKDNAKHFGGDPENIVLFGESAGAFSVSLHMVSPLSKNLFKRSILQSGSAYHPMYSDDKTMPLMSGQAIASMLGCATDKDLLMNNPKEVVDCLKRLPAKNFAETDLIFSQNGGMLLPSVGNDFLPESPIDLYRKGNFNQGEVLIGGTQNEGPLLLAFFKSSIFGFFGERVNSHTFNETSAKELISSLTQLDSESEKLNFYFNRVKESSRYTYLDAMADIYGDFIITCGNVFQADYQSMKGVPVYFYMFNYRSPSAMYPEWFGVPHAAELPFVFGNPMFKAPTEFEEGLSKDIMDMWIAFAKTGNPSIPGGIKWPLYNVHDQKYYSINQRDSIGVRPDNNRCDVWRDMFRSVIPKHPIGRKF